MHFLRQYVRQWAQGLANLYDRIQRMSNLHPMYIDVTMTRDPSSRKVTLQICRDALNKYGLETCMHLTCTGTTQQDIDGLLEVVKYKVELSCRIITNQL